MNLVKKLFLGFIVGLLVSAVICFYGWLTMLLVGVLFSAGVVGGTLNLVQSCVVWFLLVSAFSINKLPPKRNSD